MYSSVKVRVFAVCPVTDPDDPEYLRELRRPADVKQDVRQMEDRRRVKLVLNSKAFRNELERLVDERIKSGEPCPPSLVTLQQQISGLNLPQSRLKHGALVMQGTAGNEFVFHLPSTVIGKKFNPLLRFLLFFGGVRFFTQNFAHLLCSYLCQVTKFLFIHIKIAWSYGRMSVTECHCQV